MFVHYSAIETDGYRSLEEQQRVEERLSMIGFRFPEDGSADV